MNLQEAILLCRIAQENARRQLWAYCRASVCFLASALVAVFAIVMDSGVAQGLSCLALITATWIYTESRKRKADIASEFLTNCVDIAQEIAEGDE